MSQAGKVIRHWQDPYSVRIERDDDGYEDVSVDLDAASKFHKAERQENVSIVMIPRSRHGDWSCLDAKIPEHLKTKGLQNV